MENTYIYNNNVTWKFRKIGEISDNNLTPITVATPPEFPGGVPNTWSPEHLFVASVNVCLMTTFLAIAENSKLLFSAYSANASGKLEKVDGKFMFSEITINPIITVTEEKEIERAYRIVDKAEQHCLISNSVKTKIILEPEIIWTNKSE